MSGDSGTYALVKIQATDVDISYQGKPALKKASLAIRTNTIHSIIGPAGSGKTSFMRSINLMSIELDGAQVKGSIKIDDEEILTTRGAERVAKLRRRVGIVFATPQPLPRSIYENLAFGPRIAGVKKRATLDEIVEESLRSAQLWDEVKDRLDLMGTSLSGGQQQRLCLARTLALKPDVVLLDEPCSALDPISTYKIEQSMQELKGNITFVLVTNNTKQAARVADRTAFFLMGELVEDGPTAKIFTRPNDQRTGDYIEGRFG
jgi:phosphate transport system ATP-binding protein